MLTVVDAGFLVEEGTGPARFGTCVDNVRIPFGAGEVDFCFHQLKRLFVMPFSIGVCEGSTELVWYFEKGTLVVGLLNG